MLSKKRSAKGASSDILGVPPFSKLQLGSDNLNNGLSSNDIRVNFLLEPSINDPRPYLPIRIFGFCCKALLDSGASDTVIGQDLMWLFDKFPAKITPLTDQFMETADHQKHVIIGKSVLPITLAHKTKCISVFVVPSLSQKLFWG